MRKRTLWICQQPVKVRYVKDLQIGGEFAHGAFTLEDMLIEVNASHPKTLQVAAVLHEALHASVALLVGSSAVRKSPDPEEVVVRAADVGMFSLVRDPKNRWFVDQLLGEK